MLKRKKKRKNLSKRENNNDPNFINLNIKNIFLDSNNSFKIENNDFFHINSFSKLKITIHPFRKMMN